MSRTCGFCMNLGFDVAARSHGVRECWRLANTQCLGCSEYGHTVSRCPQGAGQNQGSNVKRVVTAKVRVQFTRKDTPRPALTSNGMAGRAGGILTGKPKGAFGILAGVAENERQEMKNTKKDVEKPVMEKPVVEEPLFKDVKPKPLIGAWGNGAPASKLVESVPIRIPPAAAKTSVVLSVVGATGVKAALTEVTDLGWADDDDEFDEDPATMFDN